MDNYLKSGISKALSLVLAFTVALGLLFVISTDRSFAISDQTYLDNAKITVDVPKCGTKITAYSSYEQEPSPDVKIADTDPHYDMEGSYYTFWSTENGARLTEETVVKGGAPLYLAVGFTVLDGELYAWKNDDPTDFYGNYEGTLTVNGETAELTMAETYFFGYYLETVIKLMPEHDWDDGKVTKEPTATEDGVKTYTCKGCGETRTEPIPATGGTKAKVCIAKMEASGDRNMTISWTKVGGAAGYDIFLSKCNRYGKEYSRKKVKTIKGNKTFKWTKKGLKKRTPYKCYVKAFVKKDGKKKYISKSPGIHAFTSGGDAICTNPKSVKVKKASVKLAKGKKFKIKASVEKLDKSKKLINTSHTPKLRYKSSNKKVATVSKSGKITAKGSGTCKVYAIATNGVSKKIKVTVK